MAIESSLYKYSLLLFGWYSCWTCIGMGFSPRCYGTILVRLVYGSLLIEFSETLCNKFNIYIYIYYQGIWAGMIFGGTALQTVILAIITIRCDWEKEVN